jgi:hypothetical protein
MVNTKLSDTELIDICGELVRKRGVKKHKSLFKLPPHFTDSKENSAKNLKALFRVLFDYEDVRKNLKLVNLPSLYNYYGGLPKLDENQYRTVHNWLLQAHFAYRAVLVEKAIRHFPKLEDSSRWVYDQMYSNNKRKSFIAKDGNSYKPLRYATPEVMLKWIYQECEQNKLNKDYGAKITNVEWELYGLHGKLRTAQKILEQDIDSVVKVAKTLDYKGFGKDADELDDKLNSFLENLQIMDGN